MERLKWRRAGSSRRFRVRDRHVIRLHDGHRRRDRFAAGQLMGENRRHRQRLSHVHGEVIT